MIHRQHDSLDAGIVKNATTFESLRLTKSKVDVTWTALPGLTPGVIISGFAGDHDRVVLLS